MTDEEGTNYIETLVTHDSVVDIVGKAASGSKLSATGAGAWSFVLGFMAKSPVRMRRNPEHQAPKHQAQKTKFGVAPEG